MDMLLHYKRLSFIKIKVVFDDMGDCVSHVFLSGFMKNTVVFKMTF